MTMACLHKVAAKQLFKMISGIVSARMKQFLEFSNFTLKFGLISLGPNFAWAFILLRPNFALSLIGFFGTCKMIVFQYLGFSLFRIQDGKTDYFRVY